MAKSLSQHLCEGVYLSFSTSCRAETDLSQLFSILAVLICPPSPSSPTTLPTFVVILRNSPSRPKYVSRFPSTMRKAEREI